MSRTVTPQSMHLAPPEQRDAFTAWLRDQHFDPKRVLAVQEGPSGSWCYLWTVLHDSAGRAYKIPGTGHLSTHRHLLPCSLPADAPTTATTDGPQFLRTNPLPS